MPPGRRVTAASAALYGIGVGLLMAGTRFGVFPSHLTLSIGAILTAIACRGRDPRESAENLVILLASALVSEAAVNCAPALAVGDRVLANAILLVGVGDAVAGQLILIPVLSTAAALAALASGYR